MEFFSKPFELLTACEGTKICIVHGKVLYYILGTIGVGGVGHDWLVSLGGLIQVCVFTGINSERDRSLDI